MQFSIRLLLFLLLCGALVANGLQNQNREELLRNKTPALIEASQKRQEELKLYERGHRFYEHFFKQRQIRKAEADEALAKFREVAERNSRITPDDSGRWFARRFAQHEKEASGIRVWIPEQAELQLVVGFTSNGRARNREPLRSAKHFLPAEVWKVRLPAGESTISWNWEENDSPKSEDDPDTPTFTIVVNDQSRVIVSQVKQKPGRGNTRIDVISQRGYPVDRHQRVFSVVDGGSNSGVERIHIAIEPVGGEQ